VKRAPLKRKTPLRSRSRLRIQSDDDSAEVKRRIQAFLRECVIIRDGGCVLRLYPESGACGGCRNDGQLILQAEHLVTRSNSVSYGDLRNIVCLCQRHHGFFKPQYSRLYWELIERHIGPERWAWIKRVEADRRPYRFYLADWKALEVGLTADLAKLRADPTFRL
jgi:hypothetical protein